MAGLHSLSKVSDVGATRSFADPRPARKVKGVAPLRTPPLRLVIVLTYFVTQPTITTENQVVSSIDHQLKRRVSRLALPDPGICAQRISKPLLTDRDREVSRLASRPRVLGSPRVLRKEKADKPETVTLRPAGVVESTEDETPGGKRSFEGCPITSSTFRVFPATPRVPRKASPRPR
jgi:hypothetical protein